MSRGRLYLFDILAIAFLSLLAVSIALLGRDPHRWLYAALDAALAVSIAVLAFRFGDDRRQVLRFVRHWYLAPTWYLCYVQTSGVFVHLVWPRTFDAQLIQLETSVFGVLPNLWLERIFTPVLTEIMTIGYYTYFFQMVAVAAVLYFVVKRAHPFHETVAAASIAYFASYATFVLFPVAGPRFMLPPGNYDGLVLTEFMRDFISRAGNCGGAFPSSHVAVAVVSTVFAMKYHRVTGRVMLGTSLLIAIGTIYGAYHYVADVVAGIVYGVAACVVAPTLVEWFEKRSGAVDGWSRR